MTELMLNALLVKKIPESIKVMETDIAYPTVNQFLAKFRDVHYFLHANNLYFIGDEEKVQKELTQGGFKAEFKDEMKIDLANNWQVTRPILYKALRFFLLSKNFIWKPRARNEVFITNPTMYEGTKLVHDFNSGEMFLHEGFRFYFEFMHNQLFLLLVPRVTPLLPIRTPRIPRQLVIVCRKVCNIKEKCRLPKKKIWAQSVRTFRSDSGFCPHTDYYIEISGNKQVTVPFWSLHYEASSRTVRERGLYKELKRIAQKRNREKRNILEVFSNILSEAKDEIIIPVGNLNDGLIIHSDYLMIKEKEEDFYG
jgi:hypothetical protein